MGNTCWTGVSPEMHLKDSWNGHYRWHWDWWSCDEASCRRHSVPNRQWMCHSGATFWLNIPWQCQLEGRPWPAGCLVGSSAPLQDLLWSISQGTPLLWSICHRFLVMSMGDQYERRPLIMTSLPPVVNFANRVLLPQPEHLTISNRDIMFLLHCRESPVL